MSLKNTEKILSTLYQREREIAGVYFILKSFSSVTPETKEALEKAEQEDKKHASFLRERLRQLGVEVQKLKEESEKTIGELREALNKLDKDQEKLNILLKVLTKIKKSEIELYRSYLELETRDELSQQLLERIANSETHHLLKLEVLNLVEVEIPSAERKEESLGDSLS